MSDEFMTVAEVAERLKLNQQTVWNWIDRGEPPAFHAGRRVRIRREDFDALIEAGSTGSRVTKPSEPIAPMGSIWGGEVPTPVEPPGGR